MVFTKRLREGIRRGRIRCSVRIWRSPHVKAGGRYQMDDGHIVVDSIVPIALSDVTDDLARESGFDSVDDLLGVAKHGSGDNVYLIRFHYLAPGAWDRPVVTASPAPSSRSRTDRRLPRSPRRRLSR
jgi:hypothetical protein